MKRDDAVSKPGGFDEHERDTAQRAYPKEIVDSSRGEEESSRIPPRKYDAQATTKMARVDLDTILRKESGTRPAVTREDIERAMQRGVALEDPHARATVTAVPRSVMEAAEPPPAVAVELLQPTPTPLREATPPGVELPIAVRAYALVEEPRPVSPRLPRWVVPLVALAVGIVVSLAFASGFILGRVSALH